MKKSSTASTIVVLSSLVSIFALAQGCGSKSNDNVFDTTPTPGKKDASTTVTGDDDDAGFPVGDDSSLGTVSDGSTDDVDSGLNNCANATASATRQPVYMLFVLDGSGSMDSSNKWTAATGAVDAIFADMQAKADNGVGAGLIVFSDKNDKTNASGPYPSSKDVPIAFVDAAQAAKLTARIAPPDAPSNDTPTGTALTGGFKELSTFTPALPLQPGGKKVLVLITDGVPTDACSTAGDGSDNYTQNACVVQAAGQLTAAAPAGPIETFVIGVGSVPGDFGNYDPYFLGALAVAGGSSPAGCNPKENTAGATDFCYFNVDPTGSSTATQTAFEAAINNIRGQVSSCTFALGATDAGAIDPSKVNVTVNGQTIPQDPVNGWTYDDPNNPKSVTLHGTSCDQMKGSTNAQVSIVLGCVTVKPPPAK